MASASTMASNENADDSASSTLLREWSYPSDNNLDDDDDDDNDNITPPAAAAAAAGDMRRQDEEASASEHQALLPPVAPAVVLSGDDSNKPKDHRYVPVATFVSNLVRTGLDHITAIAERVDEQHNNNNSLSVRSEGVATALRGYGNSEASVPEATSLRTVESEVESGELVIINGDLVAIGPQQTETPRGSRRSRMRRGMKKIGKWFKRRTQRFSDESKKNKKKSRNRTRVEPETNIPSTASNDNSVSSAPSSEADSDEASETVPNMVPMAPITECDTSGSGDAVAADFIGNADLLAEQQVSVDYADHHQGVPADFIGHADQLLEAGVLANVASADAYIEHDEKFDDLAPIYGKEEKTKVEDHQIESMLQQARYETVEDPEHAAELQAVGKPQAKSDAKSDEEAPCPLSEAKSFDRHVYNDTLKIVMVGSTNDKSALARALSGKKPKRLKPTLGVDVHTWTPDLKFTIWDINSANAGAHPATQSLFFSANALFVLVWDLAAHNIYFQRPRTFTEEEDEDEEEYEFLVEETHRQADRALELDINDRVLSWLDTVATNGSGIVPVVTTSEIMDEIEVRRRSSMLQALLMQHPVFNERPGAPKLIVGNDGIHRVNMDTGDGISGLQEMIRAIAQENVFDHVKSSVAPGTVEILETVRKLKEDHKVILLDHLLSEMKEGRTVEEVKESLRFLSDIGELLYFGNSTDEILSRYVILSRKWLVSALSCILRPDLQRELGETRRFMNLQCVYSGQQYSECDIVQILLQGTQSSCPILSAKDSAMLWKSMSFMREAADRTAQLSEASTTMYDFLERLLVHSGIFLPLTVASEPTYFVPSLLAPAEPSDVWTYKTSDSWMTTLCHTWLLRDYVPSNIMEHVTTSLLQDLYEYSNTYQVSPARPLRHSKTFPMTKSSLADFMETHDSHAMGRVRIHQVMCWKSSFLVRIGTAFGDPSQAELRESIAEIFVALVDDQSELCVAANTMRNGMKRVIVCGKGQVGFHGRKLWKGGYGLVLDSVKASLADVTGADRQVVCPECLAHSHPSVACTWGWDSVRSTIQTGGSGLRCTRGHSVDSNLLCGTCIVAPKRAPPAPAVAKPVPSLLGSVVVVGLWDGRAKQIRSVGSGFIADKKQGLIVTAAHVLFDMSQGRKFGTQYFGLKNAKVVIGVIPDDGHTAIFRYFADLVAHDVHNVDACVLRITTRLEKDVGGEGEACGDYPEIPLPTLRAEQLSQLRITTKFELEETVRVLGFNQGGEGILEQGKHVNRSADFAKGYICKKFRASPSDDSSTDTSSASSCFSPREEIVVMCPTISGHSGGPCVNDEGRVVGILSRADPVDRQRCYLVPSSELKRLLQQARGGSAKKPLMNMYT